MIWSRNWSRSDWTTWASHVARSVRGLLSVVQFGHSPDSSTPELWISVAISPTVDGSLNESALSSQARIEFSKSPANGVALGLVDQPISSVLVLSAARPWINAVLGLEFLAKIIDIDGLNIASDGVFHLDTVPRIFESDPLNSIVILSNNKRSRCWDRPWCSIRVDTPSTGWTLVHPVAGRRRGLRVSIRVHLRRWRSLLLHTRWI